MLIENIEKSVDMIVEEITRLSKKYLPTQTLHTQKERLINLRSNIDQLLFRLEERFVADFTSEDRYAENFSRLVQSIRQV
ncbi:hypothetical protein MHK_006898 [Candidatus Magnetomorum sp. HK-1]|nr:hypothetical protein MHK_006898 [Candidatus Magnetomorum sp. HK-1]